MKRETLGVAIALTIIYSGLALGACASLGGYFSPAIQADEAAVTAATVTVNNDALQTRVDYAANKAALPADATKATADGKFLAAAVAKWVGDLKAAGQPVSVPTPGSIAGNAAAAAATIPNAAGA